ncbi:MAG: flagellar filament capping protein FliD [Melioribacteraceae bacterium]|nr:flagellar filament capping protein FliD [Melioribacteraceae bacterium]
MSSLTTSSINNLVTSYKASQTNTRITPLLTRKTGYENKMSSYSTLSSKLDSLKSLLTNFKLTGSSSVFASKTAVSSDSDVITADATASATKSAYELFVSQLAKNDIAVSKDLESSTSNPITGTHTFQMKAGDGEGGEFVSNVEVEFSASETNETMMEKIRDAVNSDKAVVESTTKTGSSSYSGGGSTITFDINGTETEVTVNGGGTYEELIDELVSSINTNVSGVTAEKVSDSGNVSLKLTVDDSDDYISISHSADFDLVSDLGISVTQEKGASGIATASVFTPRSGYHQLSITAKQSGLDYRLTELSDAGASAALSEIGLNLGSARPTFDQSLDPDTAGFVYSDITDANNQLNSKFSFNGLDIQKSSNNVDDLVEGMTFNLHSVMQETDNDVSISVNNDVASVKGQVEDFISKFNDVYKYIVNNSISEDGHRGIFVGDSQATALRQSLLSAVITQVSELPANDISYLSQIGISFDSQSGLSISNSSLLESRIEDSAEQIEALFNSTSGLANNLYDLVDPYLGADGYLANASTSLDSTISYLGNRITSIQERIDASAEILRSRYQRMQVQLAQLYSSQSIFIGNSGESFF